MAKMRTTEKEDLLKRRDQVPGKSRSHRRRKNNEQRREKEPREKHGRRRDDEWTETCPASTTVHGPAENGKE